MKKRAWAFHPDAQNELNAAAELYNEARPGIGDAFLDAVDDKLAMLSRITTPGTRVAGIKVKPCGGCSVADVAAPRSSPSLRAKTIFVFGGM